MAEPVGAARPAWARWEWGALVATAAALVLLAAWPTLRAPSLAPEDAQFLGLAIAVRDGHFYLSLIRQEVGLFPFLRNPFAEPEHERLFTTVYWWGLAHVRQATGLRPVAVYHLARYAATLGCVAAIAAFATVTTRTRGERWLAIQLAIWGSGFGWLVGRLHWNDGRSADLLTPEVSTFYTVLSFPHIAAALALLVGCATVVLLAMERESPGPWRAAGGVLAALLGIVHPFNLIVLLGAWGLYAGVLALRDRGAFVRWVSRGWPMVAGGVLAIAYFVAVLALYPSGLPENVIRHLPYRDLALGLGLLGLGGAVYGVSLVWRRTWAPGEAWCAAWIVATVVLMHSYPLIKQEGRVVLGINIPLSVWTALLVCRSTARWPRAARLAAGVAIVLACVPTTFNVTAERVRRLARFPGRFYLLDREAAAIETLAAQLTPQDVVVCSPWNGLVLSGRVPARMFVGYWDEASYEEHEHVAHRLFAEETSPEVRRALSARYGITAIWVAEAERGVYSAAGLGAAVRDLATEILVESRGVLAVRVGRSGEPAGAAAAGRGGPESRESR